MKNYSLTPDKFLSEEELKSFLEKRNNQKGKQQAVALGLLLYTGARECELIAIKKKDIQNQGAFVFGRKNSNDGHQVLPEWFYKELVEYISHLKDEAILFPVTTRTLRNWWYNFTPNFKKGLHCLRHTYGFVVYEATRDIRGVKNGLRHKNIKNTMIYLDYIENIEAQKSVAATAWAKPAA